MQKFIHMRLHNHVHTHIHTHRNRYTLMCTNMRGRKGDIVTHTHTHKEREKERERERVNQRQKQREHNEMHATLLFQCIRPRERGTGRASGI